MANLVYKTDFEDIVQTGTATLSLPISHGFQLGAVAGGARIWMDDGTAETNSPTPHSGSRCVGMETTTSERNEFNILNIQNLAGQEYYMSMWLYLPVGWTIPLSHWYSIGQPFQKMESPWLPSIAVHPNNWGGRNKIDIDYGTPPNMITVATIYDYLPPVGRWFKFEYYVRLDPVQGKCKVWIDGILICDVSNLLSINYAGEPTLCQPAKIYGADGVGTWRIWVDDLEIWSGMPSVTPLPVIRGYVTDSQTGAAIAGVIVTCDGYTDVTEIDGFYEFGLDIGKVYALTFQKDGYDTKTVTVDASAGGTFRTDITLVKSVLPPPTQYTLTISATVGGATNPVSGQYTVVQGQTVQVTATPSSGYAFNNWILDGSNVGSTNPITVIMNADHSLQAVFVALPVLTISSTSGGTTSPSPGSYATQQGATQQVAALPNSGYLFDHWELDGVNVGSANPYTVTMNTNHTLRAVFAAIPTVTLTILTTAGGTTSPSPGSYAIQQGTTQQVAAIPSTGYLFVNWLLDGATRTENPITVLMSTNHTLQAVFQALPPPPPDKYYLTIHASINGSTNPMAGTYAVAAGATFQVIATPNSGYLFDHWELDGANVGSTNPITVVMSADHALTAVFSAIPQAALMILSSVGGATTPSAGTYAYTQGQTAQVLAIADTNYQFTNWLIDGVSQTVNPISILMNQNYTLQPIFEYVPPPPVTATIQGKVKNATTGNPIVAAVVTCNGYTNVTQVDGSYLFQDVPPKMYQMTISKEGYSTLTVSVDASADGTLMIDFNLEPYVPPIPKHTLTISVSESGTTYPAPGSYQIDEGLTASVIAVPATNYRLANWLLDDTTSITDNPIIVLMNTDHTLEAMFEYVAPPPVIATIQGKIQNTEGTALEGAVITCDGYADITEVDGSYAFTDIPAQLYNVKAMMTGYQDQTFAVDASAGGVITIVVTLVPLPPTPKLSPAIVSGGLTLLGLVVASAVARR